MMALRPEDRYADPAAAMQALLPFLRKATGKQQRLTALSISDRLPDIDPLPGTPPLPEPGPRAGEFRVLVVDDDSSIRALCRQLLAAEGAVVETAAGGAQGLAMALKG